MNGPESSPHARLLRWYPASWRARYGDELTALLEDTFGDGPIPWRTRAATAKAGVVQHLRARVWATASAPPTAPATARSSCSAVGLFVVAGAMLAKFNEHWDAATPQHDRWLPTTGYIAIEAAAALGVLTVLVAGLIAPLLLRSLQRSGWASVRPQVRRVGAVGLTTVAVGIPVIVWAHHLTSPQRNGGLAVYSAFFFVVGFLRHPRHGDGIGGLHRPPPRSCDRRARLARHRLAIRAGRRDGHRGGRHRRLVRRWPSTLLRCSAGVEPCSTSRGRR